MTMKTKLFTIGVTRGNLFIAVEIICLSSLSFIANEFHTTASYLLTSLSIRDSELAQPLRSLGLQLWKLEFESKPRQARCEYELLTFIILTTGRSRLGPVNRNLSVCTSPTETQLLFSRKGEADLYQSWSDLDPFPLVKPSTFLMWWYKVTLPLWSERLAKGPYLKNTPLAVRL